jgi:hypothetical protein
MTSSLRGAAWPAAKYVRTTTPQMKTALPFGKSDNYLQDLRYWPQDREWVLLRRTRASTKGGVGIRRQHRFRQGNWRVRRVLSSEPDGTVLQFRSIVQLPSAFLPEISLSNHTLASFQSRMTVSGEIFRTSAVSFTLRPPKNRNSTTWLFRGSTSLRRLNARSTSIKSGQLSGETIGAFSKLMHCCPPPLLRIAT